VAVAAEGEGRDAENERERERLFRFGAPSVRPLKCTLGKVFKGEGREANLWKTRWEARREAPSP
jgi:hypothetical protein